MSIDLQNKFNIIITNLKILQKTYLLTLNIFKTALCNFQAYRFREIQAITHLVRKSHIYCFENFKNIQNVLTLVENCVFRTSFITSVFAISRVFLMAGNKLKSVFITLRILNQNFEMVEKNYR